MGESSRSGIFVVVEGRLGVFLDEGDQLRHTNTLRAGESVGDLDVLDGAGVPPPKSLLKGSVIWLVMNYIKLRVNSTP